LGGPLLWQGGYYGRVHGGAGCGGGVMETGKIELSIDPLLCFVKFVAGISFLKTPKRAISTHTRIV
jgi:hypothetical protein